MAEADGTQIYKNALPMIAVVMMASGVLVKSVPLESRRPVDPQRVAPVFVGHQDIEARLWQDPFTAIRGVEGDTPEKRCKEAKKDSKHQRLGLLRAIANRTDRGNAVSVLAVMVLGGPYFEEGEARRRSRYAVASALLQTGWEPVSEDKLGYVWTLESCIEPGPARRAPELLPYEWFRIDASGEGPTATPRRDLLVLWVNETSVRRRPLRGMERIVELLSVPCPSIPELSGPDEAKRKFIDCPGKSTPKIKPVPPLAQRCHWGKDLGDYRVGFGKGAKRRLPWCETRVIGPATSDPLESLVQELARTPRPATPESWLRFYSSGATAYFYDPVFSSAIEEAKDAAARQSETGVVDPATRKHPAPPDEATLRKLFEDRAVRLTTTDDKLTAAFVEELGRRLANPTPFSWIRNLSGQRKYLCESTIVVVSEGDTRYAREFQRQFDNKYFQCTGRSPRVVPVSYLRGMDGVLPTGGGAPAPAPAAPQGKAQDARDALLDPVTLERADGRSQFDYLRRLEQQLRGIDLEEKRAGRSGIRGVGIVGNDTYDKLLVLDALRDRFPEAVFFAADLDARLVSGGARSTRNLVVASAYGLTLNPGIQGAAAPFRDTYQTGTYLATRVALDPSTAGLDQGKFAPWFREPLLFEIGRTRAVPLSKGSKAACEKGLDPAACKDIHALDEWLKATPFPVPATSLALAAMLATAIALALSLSRTFREAVAGIWKSRSLQGAALVAALASAVTVWVVVAVYTIRRDVISGFGEPFAWFEGVSIWPTQIFRVGILVLTVALLFFGWWQLRRRIDVVAKEFGLASLTKHGESPSIPGWKEEISRVWTVHAKDGDQGDPWVGYLDRVRFRPSTVRIVVSSALFFIFSVALASLDWPYSPHRGEIAAWFNHFVLLLLLGATTALLFAAFDASVSAAYLLTRLHPGTGAAMKMREDCDEKKLVSRYPVGEQATEAWIRFRLAVRIASEVNWFIYLPFLTLLLIIPTQSSIFDAWDLPLPFAALMAISIGLAVLCARRLRKAAEHLKGKVLEALETELQNCKLSLPVGQRAAASDEPADTGADSRHATPALKAEMLEHIAEQVRTVRAGPYMPLSQEPVVRAILLVLGGAGGISTLDFLLLSRP